MGNVMEFQAIEDGVRRSAPPLPPGLRSATLTRCAQEAQKQRRRERNQLRFVYALAGMCALQWMVGNQLDAQRAALLTGKRGEPRMVLAAVPDLPKKLRTRARLIAHLMAQPYDGRNFLIKQV